MTRVRLARRINKSIRSPPPAPAVRSCIARYSSLSEANEPNIARSVYAIRKIRARASLVIDVRFERALLSYLKLCIDVPPPAIRAHRYHGMCVRRVCLVYLFYFILVYLGKAMSCGYAVVVVVVVVRKCRACGICNFLHDDVHPHFPPRFNRVILGFVSFRYRMFM